MKKRKDSIVRATILVFIISIFTKSLTFIKELLFARFFGAGMQMDAYIQAYIIPSFFYAIIGGIISAVFIPIYSDYKNNKTKEECEKFTNASITSGLLISMVIVFVCIMFSKYIISLISPGFKGDSILLSSKLLKIMMPFLPLIVLAAFFDSIVRVNKRFTLTTISVGVFNGMILVFVAIFHNRMGIYSVALALIVAAISQILVQIIPLKKDCFKFKFYLDFKNEGIKSVGKLALPLIISEALNQFSVIIDKIFASDLPKGTISSLYYGDFLISAFTTFVTSALMVVLFPYMAEKISLKDYDGFNNMLHKAIYIIGFIFIPVEFFCFFLNKPIIELFFQYGRFDAQATIRAAEVMQFYSIRLFPVALIYLILACYYSIKETKIPVIVSTSMAFTKMISNRFFMNAMGAKGLALSTSLISIIQLLLLLYFFNRKIKFSFKGYGLEFIKISVASLLLSLVGIVIYSNFKISISSIALTRFANLLVEFSAGAVLYVLTCYLFKADCMKLFIQNFIRKG